MHISMPRYCVPVSRTRRYPCNYLSDNRASTLRDEKYATPYMSVSVCYDSMRKGDLMIGVILERFVDLSFSWDVSWWDETNVLGVACMDELGIFPVDFETKIMVFCCGNKWEILSRLM
jgi:hypothetical protein